MASATKICTICDKPTIQRCSRCSEGLDENGEPLPSPTYYCSKTCQATNFQDHKAICRVANARKRLYRGALLVQQAFYTFREAAFDVQIPTFWKEGSTIHLYAQTTGEGPLYPFSNQLSMNEEDKKAILTWNACGDAAAYMSKLVEKVLDGITSEKYCPTELAVKIKDDVDRIISHLPNGSLDKTNPEHMIVRVSLKSGKQYIFDPAGAQFRQYRAAMPLDQYMKQYVKKCVSEEDLGYYGIRWNKAAKYRDDARLPTGFNYSVIWVQNEIAKAVNEKIVAWEKESGKLWQRCLIKSKACSK